MTFISQTSIGWWKMKYKHLGFTVSSYNFIDFKLPAQANEHNNEMGGQMLLPQNKLH